MNDTKLRNREFAVQMLNLAAFPVEFQTSAFVGLEPFDRDAIDALALGAGAEFVGDPCAHCTAPRCAALRCVACGRLVRFRLGLFVLGMRGS